MSDKMREEFERWAKGHYGFMRLGMVGEFYSNDKVQESWFVWQYSWNTSRGSLCVFLPDSQNDFIDRQIIQHALQQEGIRYEGFTAGEV